MPDDRPPPPARKKSCLSSGCGCLGMVLLALLATGAVAAWLLSRWDPAQKAWDRLPPDTLWAVQAHDLRTLLLAATRDPGAKALARRLDEFIVREDPAEEKGEISDFLAAYGSAGALHTMIAPNSFVIGGCGREHDAAFLIFRFPTWLRWFAALPGSGFDGVREHTDGEGNTVFFTARDGWMIITMDSGVIRRVLDGWERRALPLGPGYEDDDAHIAFAMRPDAPGNAPAAPPEPPAHFTLADPFAAPARAGGQPAQTRTEGMFLRLALRPARDGDGWQGEGHFAGDGADGGSLSLAAAVRSALGDGEAEPPTSGPHDAAASVRLSPEAREAALAALRGWTAKNGGAEGAEPGSPGLAWLDRGWLANAGAVWTALADAPAVAGAGLPYPPLPVFALGWTVREGADPAAAAEAFTGGLARWLDALRAAERPPLLRRLLESVSSAPETAADAPGGALILPPVMVNGARPTWRFHPRRAPATGWLATDPAGIPDSEAENRLAAPGTPAAGHARFACGWNMGGDFIDSLFAVVRDRAANHFAAAPGDDAATMRRLDTIRAAAAAYPRGSAYGDIDPAGRQALFRFAVPAGADGE